MKKLLICTALLLAVGLLGWLPAEQKDIGDLLPVRALVVSQSQGQLVLDGGEKLQGQGPDWASAMENLRATAPGDAFFGTAGYVILVGDAQNVLRDVLGERERRPAAQVYAADGVPEAESAAEFLDAHGGGVTMQELQAAVLEGRRISLPRMHSENGRYRLENG